MPHSDKEGERGEDEVATDLGEVQRRLWEAADEIEVETLASLRSAQINRGPIPTSPATWGTGQRVLTDSGVGRVS